MANNNEILANLFNTQEGDNKKTVLQVSSARLKQINELKSKFNLTTIAMADTILELGINLIQEELKKRK